jgi:hypothetical protein
MFISKLSLPRRTFLRGVGATLALRCSMRWFRGNSPRQTPAKLAMRFARDHGAAGRGEGSLDTQTVGRTSTFADPQALEPFRDHVVCAERHRTDERRAGHRAGPIVILTGVAGGKPK